MVATRENINGVEVFRIKENLVLATTQEIRTSITPLVNDTSISKILFNLMEVKVIDSSGIGFLVSTAKVMTKRNAAFALCHVSHTIHEIFKTIQLDDIFSIYPSEEEALADL